MATAVVLSTLLASPAGADVLAVPAGVARRTLLGCLHPTGSFRGAADLPPDSRIDTLKKNFGAAAARGLAIQWSGQLTDEVCRTDVALLSRASDTATGVRLEMLADDAPIDRRCRDEFDWPRAR